VTRLLTPVLDTSIHSLGSNPQGAASILAGKRNIDVVDRGLLRFDLGSIPSAAFVQSAQLQLRVTKVPQAPFNGEFALHRMLTPWDATATWNLASTGAPWDGPGSTAGVDYVAESSAVQFVNNIASYDFGPSQRMAEDVNLWVADAGANAGWLIKSQNEGANKSARHFGSSESPSPPQLRLTYTALAPPHLMDLELVPGRLRFSFDTVDGGIYRVECRQDAASGSWTTITNVPPGPPARITLSIPRLTPRQYYRVVAE
jgi:hypothetical protein